MRNARYVILAALVGFAVAGPACTQKAADKTKAATDTALDETRKAGEKTADAARSAAERTTDKAKEIAGKTADETKKIAGGIAAKTNEVAATTGEAITDGWITTKLKAKFADETLLENSHINVVTTDHVVALKGTVASAAARDRAVAIARGTEGVTRVVNRLVVK